MDTNDQTVPQPSIPPESTFSDLPLPSTVNTQTVSNGDVPKPAALPAMPITKEKELEQQIALSQKDQQNKLGDPAFKTNDEDGILNSNTGSSMVNENVSTDPNAISSSQVADPSLYSSQIGDREVSKKIENDKLNKLFFMNTPEPVSFVSEVIQEAVRLSASDILFEPQVNQLRVRARIDGVLYEMGTVGLNSYPAITSRVKVIAGLDPTESRKIQEGQFDTLVDNKKINLRVEIAQTILGEFIVIRIHERETIIMDLETLGMNKIAYGNYQQILKQRSGLVLVCGPTGSGKTTTLYSTLSVLGARGDLNIVTIENPVEFHLEGVNQMQTNPAIGFDFIDGLKAVVRLTPDVILVGEIRDQETSKIAVETGLTGQLVFSTIHADDSVGALFRLLELGIETYYMNSALVGIVAQRLVRRICDGCKEAYTPTHEEAEMFRRVMGREPKSLYRGKGCPACGMLAYRGRAGLYEVMLIDSVVRDFVRQKYNEDVFRQQITNKGFQSLVKDGLEKAEKGITTIEEVLANSLRVF